MLRGICFSKMDFISFLEQPDLSVSVITGHDRNTKFNWWHNWGEGGGSGPWLNFSNFFPCAGT